MRTVSAGGYHSCVVEAHHAVDCWGLNQSATRPPAGAFRQVSANYSGTCAIRTDFRLTCWATSSHGSYPFPWF